MARPLRIEYAGAWYHVMNRGAGRRDVFPNDGLRQSFLDLLEDIHQLFDVRCHAHCLMGNHYHLLLQTPVPNLGRAMRHVDGVYTQRYNRRQHSDGPLFRGRYKAQLIEDGDYLWTVSRYVHRNPLEAGLCKTPIEYAWSSYRFFAGHQVAPGWLYRGKTLGQFGGAKRYREFVEGFAMAADYDKLLSVSSTSQHTPILGTPAFVDKILEYVDENTEIPDSKRSYSVSLDAIIDESCVALAWSRGELFAAGNSQQRMRRAAIMCAARRFAGAGLVDIGAAFEISYSTVASAIHRYRIKVATNRQLADELNQLGAIIRELQNGQT